MENKDIVEKIVSELTTRKHTDDVSLMSGLSGTALLLSYFVEINANKGFLKKLNDCVTCTIEVISKEEYSYTLCNGIAGIAWFLGLLQQKKTVDVDDDFLDDIDELLYKVGINGLKPLSWDYLHGASGFLVYFLERDNQYSNLYVEYFIDFLMNNYIKSDFGIYWNTKDKYNGIVQNFGLSHGIPSLISLLSKIYLKKPNDKVEFLLNNAVNHILNYQKENEHSQFPTIFNDAQNINYNSRLAWCYGDLGVANAIACAGIALNNEKILSKGIQIAENTIMRLYENKHNIKDAGFCHGYFGTAYIYQKFYYLKQEEKFLAAANFLYEKGIDFISVYNKDGFILKKDISFNRDRYEESYDIIEGYAGIGLTLLGREDRKYTDWDKIFLLFPTP